MDNPPLLAGKQNTTEPKLPNTTIKLGFTEYEHELCVRLAATLVNQIRSNPASQQFPKQP